MLTKTALERLNAWKNLPSYKAEPRVDWLIALAIPSLILNEKEFQSGCKLLLPEFPLRKGTICDNEEIKFRNMSYKVDFYCLLGNGKHLFLEIKTDMKSVNDDQLKYLKAARNKGMYNIVQGLREIYEASHSYKKYENLKKELINAGVIDKDFKIREGIEDQTYIAYIQPKGKHTDEYKVFNFNNVCDILDSSKDRFVREFSSIIREWT